MPSNHLIFNNMLLINFVHQMNEKPYISTCFLLIFLLLSYNIHSIVIIIIKRADSWFLSPFVCM